MEPISDFDQKRKAESIVNRLSLKEDLNQTQGKLGVVFNDKSIEVADTATKAEMETLISEIKLGTATNNKIARFLELASKLGIG